MVWWVGGAALRARWWRRRPSARDHATLSSFIISLGRDRMPPARSKRIPLGIFPPNPHLTRDHPPRHTHATVLTSGFTHAHSVTRTAAHRPHPDFHHRLSSLQNAAREASDRRRHRHAHPHHRANTKRPATSPSPSGCAHPARTSSPILVDQSRPNIAAAGADDQDQRDRRTRRVKRPTATSNTTPPSPESAVP